MEGADILTEKQSGIDRIKEITAGIEQGIMELFESDRYRSYLTTMSRFHRYSLNNVMLIHAQRPDATLVAGFNKWKNSFGRHVKRGEKGIQILAPTPYKVKVEKEKLDPDTRMPMLDQDGNAITEEKEVTIPMYKIVNVFDVSQTDGKPLPQLATTLTGDVAQYEVFLEALRRTSPVPIAIQPIADDTDGFFNLDTQSITLREGMSQVQTICAGIHEIAHAKLHNYEKMTELADDGETVLSPNEKDRNTEEVEAESISYAVCQYFGIETADNSFGYIATWSKGKELKELRNSLETINKTSSELITSIEGHFQEICKERGIDLSAPQLTAPDVPTSSDINSKAVTTTADFARDFAQYIVSGSKGMKIAEIPTTDMAGIAAWAEEKLRNTDYRLISDALLDVVAISGQDSRFDDLSDRLAHMNFYGVSLEDTPRTKRPEYRLVSNFHKMAPGEDTYIQKYLHGEDSRPIPAEIVYLGTYEECLEIQNRLRDGSMTEAQAKAMDDSEKMYIIEGKTYLHIQRTDEGFDYSLYDKETSKLLDGGQIDTPEQHIYSICLNICDQHGLNGYKVSYAPKELAEALREAQQSAAMLESEPVPAKDVPLPDPTITPQMMGYFGYTDSDMLPLSKDRAMELVEKDITVYMLYSDNTEEMVFDAEDVVNHDGLFGITHEEWESVRADIPPRDVAQRFLNSPTDSMVIYQLNRDAPVELRFAGLEKLATPPDPANYEAIYTREVYPDSDTGRILENFYYIFNEVRPADFTGHSLSVSDIVALKLDGKVSYHYCDSVGFKELPAFQRPENYLKAAEMSMEDDYGMIDGIINNGKAPSLEEEKKPSVLEKLKSQPQQERKSTPKKAKEQEL